MDVVRGKRVEEAMAILRFLPHGAANAENNYQMASEDLYIKHIFADEGPTVKRFRSRSRGMAAPILKRTSHITVIVEERY